MSFRSSPSLHRHAVLVFPLFPQLAFTEGLLAIIDSRAFSLHLRSSS
jgi:hypothetical protein